MQVNILDLTTRVADTDPPLYSMVLDVALPGGVEAETLQSMLDGVGRQLDVTCLLHATDADLL
jgi:hypothetical protein